MKDGEQVNLVMLTGWQRKFDDWMKYKRGELDTCPTIKLELPDEIEQILSELRRRADDGARWIAFALLDMSDAGLAAVNQMVKQVRTAELTPDRFRSNVHKEGDTVISVVASLDLPPSELRERTNLRTRLEKYRHKAVKSIGIGVMVLDKSKAFDCASWLESPWTYDEEMERAIQSEPLRVPAPGQKLPGRNPPCICGSGKKFKKCCLSKIEAASRKREE